MPTKIVLKQIECVTLNRQVNFLNEAQQYMKESNSQYIFLSIQRTIKAKEHYDIVFSKRPLILTGIPPPTIF